MKAILLILTLATVLIAPALHAADSTQKSGTSASTKPRYRFCTGAADPAGGCTFPGKGYTVCERLLKALNSLPADTPPPVCELKLPPGFEDIAQPNWEDMSVADNMHLVYDMEQYVINTYVDNPIPPEWQQYYPNGWNLKIEKLDPATWHRVPYEIWLERFKGQITAGEVVPRIRRAKVSFNARGSETVLAYDKFPSRNEGGCKSRLERYPKNIDEESYIFLLTNEQQRPVVPLDQGFKRIVLLHRGTAYLASADVDGIHSLFAAMPPLPAHLKEDRWDYTMTQRCAFNLNK